MEIFVSLKEKNIKIMDNIELIKNMGTNITMCFLEGCPKSDKCVRHLAYEILGSQNACGSTVMPSSLKANGECNMYSEAKIKCFAKGARHLFDEIRMKHYETIKDKVMQILGGRNNFYRSLRGERLISGEQQKLIADLFKLYGYETNNLYDEYVYSF
ncbi:MAG: DUF6078 family protein [Prevotella sp.]